MPASVPQVVDQGAYQHAVARFRDQGISLPTFAQLAAPPRATAAALAAAGVERDAPDPRNLWRVHWHNSGTGSQPGWASIPDHLVVPPALSGVDATIVVLLGNRFPLIGAHKVLAAYACLAPQIVTGQFDPIWQRAVWPSTGNYARGGVAISRLMGCRGIAILPENMSRARFAWLDAWVVDPDDIIRTPGSESNVREIYEACDALAADPANVIFNQFSAFANHLAHYYATGAAAARVFEAVALNGARPARLAAFVAATGSAGTLAAGDYLKERFGSLTVAAEPLQCPTMLYNGFGAHNIQGIGDKHIPLIHNVMATDAVVAVSDRATDALDLLFNLENGAAFLAQAGVERGAIAALGNLGLSGLCNLVASIKLARRLDLGPGDVIVTVATDGAALYDAERAAREAADPNWDPPAVFAEHLLGLTDDHLLLLDDVDRARIFNLGYFTWVEQRGVSLADFEARRDQAYWWGLRDLVPQWDQMIEEFNGQTGVAGWN